MLLENQHGAKAAETGAIPAVSSQKMSKFI